MPGPNLFGFGDGREGGIGVCDCLELYLSNATVFPYYMRAAWPASCFDMDRGVFITSLDGKVSMVCSFYPSTIADVSN